MIAWLAVAGKLVERNICSWVELEEVVTFRGQKILNGLFGVAKSTLLPDGRPQLRVIMNLIPPNAVMQQLQGLSMNFWVLPSTCLWCWKIVKSSASVKAI